jgi:hypothetical protein
VSTKTFIVLARRLWRVREEFDDAYLVYDRRRWRALCRREARLMLLVLQFNPERRAA